MFTKYELERAPEYWMERFSNIICAAIRESHKPPAQLRQECGCSLLEMRSWGEHGNFSGSMEQFVKLCIALERRPDIEIGIPLTSKDPDQ